MSIIIEFLITIAIGVGFGLGVGFILFFIIFSIENYRHFRRGQIKTKEEYRAERLSPIQPHR